MTKADEPRQNRIPFMMSDAELKAIDEWRYGNRIPTRAEAIRRLCQVGLSFDRAAPELEAELSEIRRVRDRLSPFGDGFEDKKPSEMPTGEERRELEGELNARRRLLNLSLISLLGWWEAFRTGGSLEEAEAEAAAGSAHVRRATEAMIRALPDAVLKRLRKRNTR